MKTKTAFNHKDTKTQSQLWRYEKRLLPSGEILHQVLSGSDDMPLVHFDKRTRGKSAGTSADFETVVREHNAAQDLLTFAREIHCWLTSPDLSPGVLQSYRHDAELAIAKATGKAVQS